MFVTGICIPLGLEPNNTVRNLGFEGSSPSKGTFYGIVV